MDSKGSGTMAGDSGAYLVLGLAVGFGIGFGLAYLLIKRATLPPSLPTGNLTTFTRDDQGRIIEIFEKPVAYQVSR